LDAPASDALAVLECVPAVLVGAQASAVPAVAVAQAAVTVVAVVAAIIIAED
jgi:hypothetical protein